jgi:hypothetical protein
VPAASSVQSRDYREGRNGRAYEIFWRDERSGQHSLRVRASELAKVDERRARAQRGEPTVELTFAEVEAEYRQSDR